MKFKWKEEEKETVPKRHKIVFFLNDKNEIEYIDNHDERLELFFCKLNSYDKSQLIFKFKDTGMTHIIPHHRIVRFCINVPAGYFINELKGQ